MNEFVVYSLIFSSILYEFQDTIHPSLMFFQFSTPQASIFGDFCTEKLMPATAIGIFIELSKTNVRGLIERLKTK